MKMKYGLVVGIFLLAVVLASGVSAQFANSANSGFSGSTNNFQSYQPTFDSLYSGSGGDFVNINDMWPILNQIEDGQCNATSDFIIGIPPGGCTPSVVRSDLLEEQNVPVFCQLYAIKINPLIKVSSIRSISFGNKPEGVSSIVFHPARAAVKSYTTLLGDPTLNNIGYVVIILKREKIEDNMEEWISGNLTATIRYDAEEAYGTGASDYYLPVMSDEDWATDYQGSSFWLGRGFLRTEIIDEGSAKIQILSSKDKVIKTFNLKEGETSPSTYLPGYYCRAGLKIKLNSLVAPEDKALLNIDGQTVWVREGTKFLNDKCRVTKLEIKGNNVGDITIKCTGNKDIKLGLTKTGAVIRNSTGQEKEYLIGDFVYDGVLDGTNVNREVKKTPSSKWSLAYVGNIPKNYDATEKEIIILVSGSKVLSAKDSAAVHNAISKLALKEKVTSENFLKDLYSSIKISDRDSRYLFMIKKGLISGGITFIGPANEIKENVYSGTLVEEYFGKANNTVGELIDSYGSEEKENGDMFGEEALYEQIVLAQELGKFKTKSDLMDIFLDKYPSSKIVEQVRIERQRLDGTNYDNSYTSVYVNDQFHTISVVDFKSVGEGDKKVDLKIGARTYAGLEEDWNETIGFVGNLSVIEILPGKVKVMFDSSTENVKTESRTILEGQTEVFEGVEVYVKEIHIEEVAYVSIIPEVKHTTTKADFTFKIGIEKRAIELSPEKTREMLKNLNASIKKWEDIVERLGNVVKGLKGACFATSTFLMLKNMATGFSGEAAARQRVMTDFKAICDTNYGTMTRTECYNHLSDQIEGNVSATTAALKAVNAKMDAAMAGNTASSGGFFGGTGIKDQEAYMVSLRSQITSEKVDVDIGGGKIISLPKSELSSVSQIQAVLLSQELNGKGVVGNGKSQLDQSLRNVALSYQQKEDNNAAAVKLKGELGVGDISSADIITLTNKDTRYFQWSNKFANDYGLTTGDDAKKKAQIVRTSDGTNYLAVLGDETRGGIYGIEKVYERVGTSWALVKEKPTELNNVVLKSMSALRECSNPWPNGKATVSYYEAGDNKGLPAIIPFDLREGWYAMVPNSGGTFLDSSPKGYTASADVRYFKICNIGQDRVMQSGQGDDLCQSFDVNTIGSVKDFIPCPTKTPEEVGRLYTCAREAIKQASAQAGKSEISINVCNEQKVLKKGQPMSQVGGFECQDFMSPDDCKLMFNVCDPVICPPSRCDLGGKMPVSDVIQTGIIGSLVLCLPNAKEGIIFPICLSGIHAGLDAYLSILKSERDCLEKSLENGEHVGICDQITSIYMCEFFWRQLAPVMDQLIPGFVQGLISPGQGVRGGGEYALVQQSWNSMQQSVSYFKDFYAQNAFKAFNIRSSEEIGSEVCKAFVGTSVPGGADLIDNLLEPESPHQFYAQFSEIKFTEATVPATSQYKVYFHIYAGKDQGVQYKVYLKNPPATSYYQSNPTIQVKNGYIAKGSSADKSIDFIAPEGYKELCVVINAKEECGFKQVTTDFGLNYIQDKYVQEQAENTNIDSEKECISGTPSAISMVNLNLQAGVEEMATPEIAMRGIVRVCASINPGAGVNVEDYVTCDPLETKSQCGKGYNCTADSLVGGYCQTVQGERQKAGSRWKAVGNCGEGGLICWLDTDSVKNDLEAIESIEDTSIKLLDERRGLIDTGELKLEQVQEILASARLKIKSLKVDDLDNPTRVDGRVIEIIVELNKVIGTSTWEDDATDTPGAGTNRDRAEALALKATVYRMIVMQAKRNLVVPVAPAASEAAAVVPPVVVGATTASPDKIFIQGIEVTKANLEEGRLVVDLGSPGEYSLSKEENLEYWYVSGDKGIWIKVKTEQGKWNTKTKLEQKWINDLELEFIEAKRRLVTMAAEIPPVS